MAQNDTHVALIILTTQMWGGGGGNYWWKKLFRAKICVPVPSATTSVLTQNKGPDTEPHVSNPPPLLRRASMSPPPPPPPPRRAIFRLPCPRRSPYPPQQQRGKASAPAAPRSPPERGSARRARPHWHGHLALQRRGQKACFAGATPGGVPERAVVVRTRLLREVGPLHAGRTVGVEVGAGGQKARLAALPEERTGGWGGGEEQGLKGLRGHGTGTQEGRSSRYDTTE